MLSCNMVMLICLTEPGKRETYFYRKMVPVLRTRTGNSKTVTACGRISYHFSHDRGAKRIIFRAQRWLEGLIFPRIIRAVSRRFKPCLRTIRYSMFNFQNSKLTVLLLDRSVPLSSAWIRTSTGTPCHCRMVSNYRSFMVSEQRLLCVTDYCALALNGRIRHRSTIQ
jgi:hypothetical protein